MSAEPLMSSRRVLVAEDEALIRLDIVEILTEAGYDVVGEAPMVKKQFDSWRNSSQTCASSM